VTEIESPYSATFYTHNAQNSMKSARPILTIVHDLYSPTSIVDIGCGSGAWLTTAEALGFTVLRGYDGPWADPHKYTSPNIDFIPVDLEQSEITHDQRYDLAMSVEVAEHLSEPRADVIVEALCAASDVVLFGAAAANQGGVHHVNERPATYWIEKFRARGFEPFDVIRPAIWDNPDVKWWFRQNTLLFVKSGSTVLDPAKLHAMEGRIWDLVHPVSYARFLGSPKRMHQQRRALTRRARRSERRAAQLQRKLKRSRQQVQDLEAQVATMRPPRKSLRTLSAQDVPEPLRPALSKAWQALPASARTAIRPHRHSG
jgi:hypothetical protein